MACSRSHLLCLDVLGCKAGVAGYCAKAWHSSTATASFARMHLWHMGVLFDVFALGVWTGASWKSTGSYISLHDRCVTYRLLLMGSGSGSNGQLRLSWSLIRLSSLLLLGGCL